MEMRVRKPGFTLVFAGVLFLCAFGPALGFAQVCVTIDPARDAMGEGERRSATLVFEETLRVYGQTVAPAPCEASYELKHLKFGSAWIVTLSLGEEKRRVNVGAIEEIPAAYSRMVESIVKGEPLAKSQTLEEKESETETAGVAAFEERSLLFLFLGLGSVIGGHESEATAFNVGAGYRHEFQHYALDLSLRAGGASTPPEEEELVVPANQEPEFEEDDTNLSERFAVLFRAMYFLSPQSNSSTYFGGGVGLGHVGFLRHGSWWSGLGGMTNLALGYEFYRHSRVQLFLEASVDFPLFMASDEAEHERWTPVTAFVLGGTWSIN